MSQAKVARRSVRKVNAVSRAPNPLSLAPASAERLPSVHTATIVGVDQQGRPLLKFDGASSPVAAASTVQLGVAELGATATVLFVRGDASRPIVTGILRSGWAETGDETPLCAWLDNERVVLTAEREIVLRCGDASLTLRADGSVVTRGTNIVSNAAGQQRIRGASVKIN